MRETNHLTHGLYVRSAAGLKLRDEKTRRLVRRMRRAMPWLEDADEPACRGWAHLEILASTAFAILQRIRIINNKGEPRRLLSEFRQLRQTQLSYERELGMTPAARMAIKASGTRAAFDLASAMARPDDDEPEDAAEREPR